MTLMTSLFFRNKKISLVSSLTCLNNNPLQTLISVDFNKVDRNNSNNSSLPSNHRIARPDRKKNSIENISFYPPSPGPNRLRNGHNLYDVLFFEVVRLEGHAFSPEDMALSQSRYVFTAGGCAQFVFAPIEKTCAVDLFIVAGKA